MRQNNYIRTYGLTWRHWPIVFSNPARSVKDPSLTRRKKQRHSGNSIISIFTGYTLVSFDEFFSIWYSQTGIRHGEYDKHCNRSVKRIFRKNQASHAVKTASPRQQHYKVMYLRDLLATTFVSLDKFFSFALRRKAKT